MRLDINYRKRSVNNTNTWKRNKTLFHNQEYTSENQDGITNTWEKVKMKINKETQALNDTIHQVDFTDIYRTFHPKTADYTFFSSEHGTFSRIDHILDHKSSLSKFKKIEIISSIFSDHNAMTLEMNYRGKNVKNTNTWRLNNTLLNNQEITEEIKMEIQHTRFYGM